MKTIPQAVIVSAICSICALTLVLISFGAYHLYTPSCVLIVADPAKLISDGLNGQNDSQPIRSSDKTLVIKMSAHLDYLPPPPAPQAVVSANIAPQAFNPTAPKSIFDEPQANASVALAPLGQQAPLVQSSDVWPGPPKPAAPVQGLPTVTQRPMPRAPELQFNATNSKEKRYLPLKLKRVTGKSLDTGRHRYSLEFDCAKLIIIMNSNQNRVYVSEMSLELDRPSKNKTTCEVQLPREDLLALDTRAAPTNSHFQCERQNLLRFSCVHKSAQAVIPLVELQMHYIEFQTSNTTTVPQPKVFRSSQISFCR